MTKFDNVVVVIIVYFLFFFIQIQSDSFFFFRILFFNIEVLLNKIRMSGLILRHAKLTQPQLVSMLQYQTRADASSSSTTASVIQNYSHRFG